MKCLNWLLGPMLLCLLLWRKLLKFFCLSIVIVKRREEIWKFTGSNQTPLVRRSMVVWAWMVKYTNQFRFRKIANQNLSNFNAQNGIIFETFQNVNIFHSWSWVCTYKINKSVQSIQIWFITKSYQCFHLRIKIELELPW